MSLILDKNKLSFIILPTKFCPSDYQKIYHQAYQCWLKVWDQTFNEEMQLNEHLYSDNFTRQTYVAILLYDKEIAALTTLNELDLTSEITWNDSFFQVWPELTKHKLKKSGKLVLACTNVTVVNEFRRNALGISWKDLMLSMLVKNLRYTEADAMTAVLRLEKGMDKCAYRTGAYPLVRNIPYSIEGRRIDIALWEKNLDTRNLDYNIQALVDYVWNNATTFVEPRNSSVKLGEKNAA